MATFGNDPVLKADPSDARASNIRSAFQLVFPSGQMSRAEMGRRMGLSRMAIGKVVSEMLESHLLRELGMDERSGRGKRSVMLAVDPDGWRVVSLDLTARYMIRGALVDMCGHIVSRAEIPCEGMGNVRLKALDELCDRLLGESDQPILGLGVAVPGIVNSEGTVIRSVNLKWTNLALKEHIEKRLHVPAVICNDVNMGLLGECTFGRCSADSMFIKIDQGVGAAVCVDGRIVEGNAYSSGEIGHVVVDPKGKKCVCGKRGCLETVLSAPVLKKRIAKEPESRTAILAEAGQLLGKTLAMSVSLLDLSNISVSGPAEIVGDAFIGSMREELEADTVVDYRAPVALHRCEQGDDLVLLGQAIAVINGLVDSIHWKNVGGDEMSNPSTGSANAAGQRNMPNKKGD
ncbi:ROK family protein [Bifidobacterium sp. ESL0790]|uniref:ROK family protein n=1 Tax=Bifidobacterium sp. ESL0790 TaxID=2983233 RepID=UPI0023F8FDE2|nr:ROK family protein [Bifidobacterium sp. ESL0790]WEV72865.1 ROK family protein [Bifidobacterium sp. ESL0790]